MTKKCQRCQVEKGTAEFNKKGRGDGFQPHCRDCQKEWYANNKQKHIENVKKNNQKYQARGYDFLISYLRDHPCVDCGESDLVVLEFDHVTGIKKYSVSRMPGFNLSIETIRKEIAKCEVRCANCHRRATAARAGNWRKASTLAQPTPAAGSPDCG